MSALYREVFNPITNQLSSIIRTSDGANIPLDVGNTDYAAYLTWVAAGNTPDPDPNYTIDAVRASVWQKIKEQRDSRKSGGVFVDSQWIHTDDSSRIQWLGIKDTARDNITAGGKMTDVIQMMGQNLMWKTLDNTFVAVTNQLAFDVVAATKNLDAILFAQAETKRAAVYAMTDPASYDTTTGWNKTYAESVAS